MMGNIKNVIFVTADISLAELNYIQDILLPVMDAYGIEMTGIREVTNSVEIALKDMKQKDNVIGYLNENIQDFNLSCVYFTVSAGIKYT